MGMIWFNMPINLPINMPITMLRLDDPLTAKVKCHEVRTAASASCGEG